jgi:hypothetical protein
MTSGTANAWRLEAVWSRPQETSMNSLYDAVRLAHIAAGTAALVAFWTTAAMKKGTPLHRRTGTYYVWAMMGVLATSPLLAAFAYARGRWVFGTFLLYLVLITGTALWLTRQAIRQRRNVAGRYGTPWRVAAWANLAGGAGMLGLGIYAQSALLGGMSLVGLLIGAQMLKGMLNPSTDGTWWVRRHIAGICGCGIATHIAFMNIGLAHALPPEFAQVVQMVGWFGPVVVGFAAARVLDRRYGGGRLASTAAG